MFEMPLYIIIITLFLAICLTIATFYFFWRYYFVLKPALIYVGKPETKNVRIEANDYLKEHWKKIRISMTSSDVSQLKLTIIEADTIIEDILRLNNLVGETMAALLSEASLHSVIGAGKLWQFHRIRNQLVHDTAFKLELGTARDILQKVDEVLKIWGF
ncbi:MAG: hypothetical protein AAB593_00775 [Patescibacteria group bacterium]